MNDTEKLVFRDILQNTGYTIVNLQKVVHEADIDISKMILIMMLENV